MSGLLEKPTTVYAVREGKKFNTDTTLVVVSCYSCKIKYAIPASLDRSARRYPGDAENGWWLTCPLGHTWGYVGKSVDEKLEEEQARHAATRDLLRHEERSHVATKGHLTRVRNEKARLIARVANGVCPCCNRTFKQLARHMTAKHPEYLDEQAQAA